MNRENGSTEAMDSVGSNESLNWFMEGEMDIGMSLNADDGVNSSTLEPVLPLQAKKRNSYSRSRSRGQGSDSQGSDDHPSRTRPSRKKYVKRKDESAGSGEASGRSVLSSTAIAAHERNFMEAMKSSSSRLSRSLSSSKGGNVAAASQALEGPLNSSGDESGTGRSEAALAAEQKFKDKNREHARNTRSRKKQYIEALKQAFQELSAEREQLNRERNEMVARLAEQAAARKQALRSMFYYRATGELSREKWEAILEEDFQMVLPVTPYRSFPPDEVVNGQRHISGIDAMILDNASLAVMVQSIGRHRQVEGRREEVRVRYYSGLDDTVMSGDAFMCRWILRTENAVECGACHECFKQGMVHAKFSAGNKLVRLELSYDVMCFMQQLRRASGKRYFEVIPNTMSSATEDCDDPNDDSARIITTALPPYTIIKVSRGWCEMTGFSAVEAVGRTCKILQGQETDHARLRVMMESVKVRTDWYCLLYAHKLRRTICPRTRRWSTTPRSGSGSSTSSGCVRSTRRAGYRTSSDSWSGSRSPSTCTATTSPSTTLSPPPTATWPSATRPPR